MSNTNKSYKTIRLSFVPTVYSKKKKKKDSEKIHLFRDRISIFSERLAVPTAQKMCRVKALLSDAEIIHRHIPVRIPRDDYFAAAEAKSLTRAPTHTHAHTHNMYIT